MLEADRRINDWAGAGGGRSFGSVVFSHRNRKNNHEPVNGYLSVALATIALSSVVSPYRPKNILSISASSVSVGSLSCLHTCIRVTIASLTILTGDDWEKFQSLFVKLYPSFFINLKEKVTDITPAEMRMAALSRLHLSTHQLAAILGVSPNSVYKTQRRLRQRLNLQPEDDVENTLLKL